MIFGLVDYFRRAALVEARNLLTEAWTATKLRSFFGDLPVSAWFNRTAPSIKSGEIDV